MRKPQVSGTTAAVLTVSLLGACGAIVSGGRGIEEAPASVGPPTALALAKARLFPGEQLTFELSLRGITGGEATIAVGQPGKVDGHNAIIMSSRVESAGVVAIFKEVRDEVTTWVDLDTSRPFVEQAKVKFGDRESTMATEFGGGGVGSFDLDFTPKGGHLHRIRQAMPADQAALDVHAALGALRSWDAADGEQVYLYILAGRQLWQTTVRMTGRESITTALGHRPVIRLDGVARRVTRDLREDKHKEPRYFTLWLSDDGDRLPLLVDGKTEYGDVKAELIEYERPDGLSLQRASDDD